MKKKLLSLVMACAMILSLAVPAFATGYFQSSSTESTTLSPDGITFNAKIHVPTVKMAMPVISSDAAKAPVVLNPYKLSYSVQGTDQVNEQDVGNNEDKVKQVISPIYGIKNLTNVPLKFDVKTETTLGSSNFELAANHITLTEKAKKAYLTLVVRKTAVSAANAATMMATTAAQWLNPDDMGANETVVLTAGEKSTATNQIRKLAATDGVDANANWLMFQFQGEMTRTPDVGWASDDTFSTVLTFTFTPEGNPDYTAKASLTTSAAAGAEAQNDFTLEAFSAALANNTTAGNTKYDTLVKVGSTAVTIPKTGAAITATTKYTDLADSTPGWALLSAGSYGATLDASAGTIKYPKTITKNWTAAGTYTDYLLVGFTDNAKVPRTIAVTVTFTHTLGT